MYNNPFYNAINADLYRNQIGQNFQQPYMPFNPYVSNMGTPQSNNNQSNLFIRRVSSIEEARAAIVDPVGTYFFADMGTGKIYMKQMKNDGTAEFYTFGVEQTVTDTEKKDPLMEINQRLTNIEEKLGGIVNVQSVSGNGTAGHSANAEFGTANGSTGYAKNAGSGPSEVPKVQRDDDW